MYLNLYSDGTLLKSFVDHVRQALQSANIHANLYLGHSFCIGTATTAAAAEIAYSTIQTLDWWQSYVYFFCILDLIQQIWV